MKTVAKVFIIIGMVLGFYMIYPIILGYFALKNLKTATKADDLRVWGILTIIFVSTLGGIFMLLIKDEELAENIPTPATEEAPAEEPAVEPELIEEAAEEPVEEPKEE